MPNNIFDEDELTPEFFDLNSYANLEICKGMYSLKEAAILAYEKLRENPAKYGFVPFKHNAEIWRHVNQAITFYLAVDDLD